ncbi:MAG: cytochrome (ubi)quinol oxidase subunit III, partial [Niabella sp.]
VIMIYQLYKKGLTHSNIRKSIMAGIFWHFLDVVWIFIFTIVYLFGGIL